MPPAACLCLVCRDYGDRDNLDNIDTKLVRDIDEAGWGVVGVPADATSAGWAFTVGLWHTFRSPEVAIFGLEPAVMMKCLNLVGDEVSHGRFLAATDVLDHVLEDGFRVTVRRVDPGWRKTFFGTSLGFYRATPLVPWLQLLWPDRQNRFPGDLGFDGMLDELQPLLWLPREDHPPGPWTQMR
jgi:hypothetical protein